MFFNMFLSSPLLVLILSILFFLLPNGLNASTPSPTRSPNWPTRNILMIVIDDLRWTSLNAPLTSQGRTAYKQASNAPPETRGGHYEGTPNFERIGREG